MREGRQNLEMGGYHTPPPPQPIFAPGAAEITLLTVAPQCVVILRSQGASFARVYSAATSAVGSLTRWAAGGVSASAFMCAGPLVLGLAVGRGSGGLVPAYGKVTRRADGMLFFFPPGTDPFVAGTTMPGEKTTVPEKRSIEVLWRRCA